MNRRIKEMVFLIMIMAVPAVAQTTFKLYLVTENPAVYFGEKYEGVSHFSIHFLIGIWKPDYSFVVAIAIEMADTINGRFEARDWGARFTGCLAGYIFNRFLFSHENN